MNNFSNARMPVLGKPLPLLSPVGFFDLNWSDKWTRTVGYSLGDIDNTEFQAGSALKSNQYALCNFSITQLMRSGWARAPVGFYRDNKSAWRVPDYRIQFSAKYDLSFRVGAQICRP
jgi:hypothetical protein